LRFDRSGPADTMQITRTTSIAIAISGIAFGAATSARAQADAAGFPSRPIRMVVGFTPGGQPDITARMLAPKLYDALRQQVIVDNRPGAGGVVAAKIVADANPDGHTLLFVSSSHVAIPAVRANLPYDTLRDFAGITITTTASYVLVVPATLNVKTPAELIALAKAKPGQLNYGSGGTGSGAHFAAEMFKHSAAIDAVHVPYRGIPEGLVDLISGRLQFFLSPLASAVSLVRDGKIRALAVTAKNRVAVYADVPTLAESGMPGFQWDSWSGLLAPAKTPRPIIDKLNREITRVLNQPDFQQRLSSMGAEASPSTPAEFDKLIVEQVALTMKLARQAGIKPE
jgi:tripartite-type tricarboxylate transporter receptor subunit TctC